MLLSDRATEERDHANGLANFQLMRGAEVEIYRKLSSKFCEIELSIWKKFESIARPNISAIGSMKSAIEAMILKEVELTNKLMELNSLAEEGIGDYNLQAW